MALNYAFQKSEGNILMKNFKQRFVSYLIIIIIICGKVNASEELLNWNTFTSYAYKSDYYGTYGKGDVTQAGYLSEFTQVQQVTAPDENFGVSVYTNNICEFSQLMMTNNNGIEAEARRAETYIDTIGLELETLQLKIEILRHLATQDGTYNQSNRRKLYIYIQTGQEYLGTYGDEALIKQRFLQLGQSGVKIAEIDMTSIPEDNNIGTVDHTFLFNIPIGIIDSFNGSATITIVPEYYQYTSPDAWNLTGSSISNPVSFLKAYVVKTSSNDFDDDGIPNDEDNDSDNDGIPDGTDNDADGDGYSNQDEMDYGSDPLNPNSKPYEDADGDGFTDDEEIAAGSDPNNPDETPFSDRDGDGFADVDENEAGSNPDDNTETPLTDRDEDGHTDGEENLSGSDPDNPDSTPDDIDGDGIPDEDETPLDNLDIFGDSLTGQAFKDCLNALGLNYAAIACSTEENFTQDVELPIGGTITNLQYKTIHFSLKPEPSSPVYTFLEPIRVAIRTVLTAICAIAFIKYSYKLLWNL